MNALTRCSIESYWQIIYIGIRLTGCSSVELQELIWYYLNQIMP